jgi:hypothetical protein
MLQLYNGQDVTVSEIGSGRSVGTYGSIPAQALMDILAKAKYTADLTADEREQVQAHTCPCWDHAGGSASGGGGRDGGSGGGVGSVLRPWCDLPDLCPAGHIVLSLTP